MTTEHHAVDVASLLDRDPFFEHVETYALGIPFQRITVASPTRIRADDELAGEQPLRRNARHATFGPLAIDLRGVRCRAGMPAANALGRMMVSVKREDDRHGITFRPV